MDNKSTTKRMIGAVVLVLVAALLLAWLLKGKNSTKAEPQMAANTAEQTQAAQPQAQQASGDATPIEGFPTIATQQGVVDGSKPELLAEQGQADATQQASAEPVAAPAEAKPAEPAKTEVAAATPAAPQGLVGKPDSEKVGFEITAAKKGEMREIIDTNGQNINESTEQKVASAEAKVAEEKAKAEAATVAKQEAAKQEVAAALAAQKAAEANTQAAAEKKAAAQTQQVAKAPAKVANPQLVNEKRVPEASSVESVARAKAHEKAKVAAAEKEAARKAALAQADTSVDATTSAAAKRHGFVIQVLATANQGKANNIRKSIAVDGYPVFVTSASINGKSVYRVRVGTYTGKRDALAVQAQMKARYRKNTLVQNSFVTNNK